MSKEDEYRRNAAEAQHSADRARNEDDRASWLRIAQGWLSLLQKRPQTSEEDFDGAVQAQDTQQQRSTESH